MHEVSKKQNKTKNKTKKNPRHFVCILICFDTLRAELPALLLLVDLKVVTAQGETLWQAQCDCRGVGNNETGGVEQSAVLKLRSSSAHRGRFESNGLLSSAAAAAALFCFLPSLLNSTKQYLMVLAATCARCLVI